MADDLAGQAQDCRVVVQYESGVGGQERRVQLECEPVGVLGDGKFALLNCGGRTVSEHRHEFVLEGGDPFLDGTWAGARSSAAAAKKQPPGKTRRCR